MTDEELDRGKGQLRGSIVLGLEDPSSRMSQARQGRAGLSAARAGRRDPGLDRGRDARRRASVAAEVLAQPKALAVVGPFDDADPFAAAIAA